MCYIKTSICLQNFVLEQEASCSREAILKTATVNYLCSVTESLLLFTRKQQSKYLIYIERKPLILHFLKLHSHNNCFIYNLHDHLQSYVFYNELRKKSKHKKKKRISVVHLEIRRLDPLVDNTITFLHHSCASH